MQLLLATVDARAPNVTLLSVAVRRVVVIGVLRQQQHPVARQLTLTRMKHYKVRRQAPRYWWPIERLVDQWLETGQSASPAS